jgi:hypothetical protein
MHLMIIIAEIKHALENIRQEIIELLTEFTRCPSYISGSAWNTNHFIVLPLHARAETHSILLLHK